MVYLPTSGGTERPPLWIHSYVLGTRLEGKSVYESSCIAAKHEVSGGHIRALVDYDGEHQTGYVLTTTCDLVRGGVRK